MPKIETTINTSRDCHMSITAYGWGSILLTSASAQTSACASLSLVDALLVWQELGAALDTLQPGATGLRPLPEGDPNEIDAMQLHANANAKRRVAVKCDR